MNYISYCIEISLMLNEAGYRAPFFKLFYAGNGELSLLHHRRHKFTDIVLAENTRSALRPLWSVEEADINIIPENNYPLEDL